MKPHCTQITVSESQWIREEMDTVYSELVNGIEPIDGRWFIQRTNRQIHQVLEMAENKKGKQRILLALFSMHFKDHGC